MYLSMFLAPRVNGPEEDRDVIFASIDQALEADAAGFAAIYLGEQHHNNYEPYSDPFTAAAWLGPQLTESWLGTSAIPLVLHHPLHLIERMNALDLLMGGRVMFGISSGQANNGTALGIGQLDAAARAQLFDQRLDVLLRAWAHSPADGALEFKTDAEEGRMTGRVMPAAARRHHPLFAVASNHEGKIVAAGERGFHVHLGPTELERCIALSRLYRESLQAGGHDAEAAEQRMRWFLTTKWIIVEDTDEQAWATAERLLCPATPPWIRDHPDERGLSLRQLHTEREAGPFAPAFGGPESRAAWTQRCHVVGSPDTVAATLKRYEEAGIQHIHARWMMNHSGIADSQRSFRLFAEEVIPRLGVKRIPAPAGAELRDA